MKGQFSLVGGIDGYPGGWIAFTVDLGSRATAIQEVDLPSLLQNRPTNLGVIAIDIPIGLLDGPRPCDLAARRLLGPVRWCSVFPAVCRASLRAGGYRHASEINRQKTGRGLSRQAWCIGPKISTVDDVFTPAAQEWAFEVHPEVCFWAMNNRIPMAYGKKSKEGKSERRALLSKVFPAIEDHILRRPVYVGIDDLLDASAAAWTALRIHTGTAECVCPPERDERGLEVAIRY